MAVSLEKREAVFAMIKYKPHLEQLKFHNSTARFRVACCGRRFGKSTMAARDIEPELFEPHKRFWIVAPTYDLGEKEFRIVWDDLIIGQGLGKDKRVKKAYNKKQGNMFIEFPWRTVLEVRSADHPENLVGEALDGLIVAEAAKLKADTWTRYLMPALSDKRGTATFPTTPEGYNWLYKLWQQGQNPKYKNWASWQFPSWANNVIYPGGRNDEEILELENNLTEEEFLQEIAAEFGAFVGKIYGEFSEKDHVRTVEYNPLLPNYMCIDWGFTAPLAAIEFQVDAQDNMLVWREHYKSWLTLPEHFRLMNAREQPEGYKIDMCFGDSADPAAIQETSQLFAPCMGDSKAKENWREGISLIKTFLKMRDTGLYDVFERPIQKSKFAIDFSCTETISEFNNYKAKTAPKGNNSPEMAQNVKNHAMDALRYGAMHVFKLGAQYHLTDVVTDSDLQALMEQQDRYAASELALSDVSDMGMFTMGERF